MLLNEFEQRQQEQGVVFSYGRLNPPHYGHGNLIRTLQRIAKQKGCNWYLFVSGKQEAKKNPLTYDQKIWWIKTLFPEVAGHIVEDPAIKSPLIAASWLYKQGYRAATFVAGEDDIASYSKMMLGGVAHGKKNPDEVASGKGFVFSPMDFAVSDRLASATNARTAVTNNDPEAFARSILGPKITDNRLLNLVQKQLFATVRRGMHLDSPATQYANESCMSILNQFEENVIDKKNQLNWARHELKGKPYNNREKKIFSKVKDQTEKLFNETEVDEANMSVGALTAFSKTSIAQSMTVGFEAEMIIPGLREPSFFQNDKVFPSKNWKEQVSKFFMQNEVNDQQSVTDAVSILNEEFYEWLLDEGFREWDLTSDDAKHAAFYLEVDLRSVIKVSNGTSSAESDSTAWQKMKEYFESELAWDLFKEEQGMHKLSDFAERFNYLDVRWPFTDEGMFNISDLAESLARALGVSTEASYAYKSAERDNSTWILEPDSSIKSGGKGGGIELISPPMPFATAMVKLDEYYHWAKSIEAYTNNTTGFHVGVSIPQQTFDNIDHLKLLLFLGDQYLLKKFDRETNIYAESFIKKIKEYLEYGQGNIAPQLDKLRQGLNSLAYKELSKQLVGWQLGDRYVSVNIKENYIEFRSAGNRYLENFDEIKNTILRYVRAMGIAADPQAYQQEYAKKTYRLLSTAIRDSDDTTKLFVQYASKKLDKNMPPQQLAQIQATLKKQLAQIQTQRNLNKQSADPNLQLVPQLNKNLSETINDNWFENGSFSTYKKPNPIKYQTATKAGTLKTLEGIVKYNPGYKIITGPKGERYPIPHKKFVELYNDNNNGTATPKKIIKTAKIADHTGTVNTSWGEPLKYTAGNDYIIKHGNNDYGVVKKDIFAQTYIIENKEHRFKSANFLGTCVNSFDEEGNCIVPGLYNDVTDFAYHEENALEISPQDFYNAAGAIPQALDQKINANRKYLHDTNNNIFMVYDIVNDVHYFFGLKSDINENISDTKPVIYLDMDGVLADFFGEWAKLDGKNHYKDINDKEAALQLIREHPSFWLDLPLLEHAKELIRTVVNHYGEYYICTKPLKGDSRCKQDKMQWIRTHLSDMPPAKVIITNNKSKYATQNGVPAVLVDDYGVNINAWRNAGGIGLKYEPKSSGEIQKILVSLAKSGVVK